jgi:hypothetical protein
MTSSFAQYKGDQSLRVGLNIVDLPRPSTKRSRRAAENGIRESKGSKGSKKE